MRYTKKIPSVDKELSDKLIMDGWTKIKEPPNLGIAILCSTPFMFINGAISMAISFYLYLPLKEFFNSSAPFSISISADLFTMIYQIVVVVLFMILHEFVHGCFIPNVFKSDKTYWGINGLVGFVYTTEKIKKERFLIISIMPFIILPFILNSLGWLNSFTIILSLINSMGSCVDFLNICLVAFQIPKSSYIVNNGFETYFK